MTIIKYYLIINSILMVAKVEEYFWKEFYSISSDFMKLDAALLIASAPEVVVTKVGLHKMVIYYS